ncbi:MAG: conjugal transfer protein TrbI [Sphingomonas sp.]|nr:conjugal transfer protein TrbI [Sphingomonas sp.]
MTEPAAHVQSESTQAPETSAQTKENPETLVLRAQPSRAIRFRRSIVILIAATAIVGVVAAAWYSLKPQALHLISTPSDGSEPARLPAGSFGNLPTSYADAPKLGPPLPGDLGQPILDHQRAQNMLPANGQSGPADTRNSKHERVLAEIDSARRSALMIRSANEGHDQSPKPATASDMSTPSPQIPTGSSAGRFPNASPHKVEFMASLDTKGDVNPHEIEPAASPYILSAGSVIPASLITGLRSDLPGVVIAQVTERVYDSPTGRILLIPQGARLIGSYDSVVAFGQRRALIVWQRIIFPDGRSLRMDNVPATDPAGYAGLADKVDFHTWTLLKGAAVSTLLGIGSNLTFTGESDLVQAIRESTQQNASRAGDQLISRDLRIQPTITIRPGTPVRLVVHHDLILPPRSKEN